MIAVDQFENNTFADALADAEPAACPCGCDKPVKPGNTYATSGCAGRTYWNGLTRAEKLEKVRLRELRMSPEQKRIRQEKLHKAVRAENWEQLLERWLQVWEDGGDPRTALRDAYRHGYLAGMHKRHRRERKQDAA